MDSSRRNLLRLCATFCGVGLAGCSSQDNSISYPTDEPSGTPAGTPTSGQNSTTGQATTEQPTTDPSETTDEQTTEPTPAAYPDLAARTETILDEISWFATEYDAAIRRYRNAINRLLSTISQIRDSSDVSEHDLQRLRNGAEDVAAITAEDIAPHFDVHDRLLTPQNVYYRNAKKFAERGDWDRADDELAVMYDYYDMRQREYVIEEELSAAPVQGRLLAALRADSIPDSLRKRHDVAKDVDSALFELYYPGASYRSFAYSEEPSMIYGKSIDHRDINAFRSFEGLEEERGRTGRAYLTANIVSKRNRKQWTYDLPNDVVFLQAYSNPATASNAIERMSGSSVSQEGTETLGGRLWQRVYYYYDGDIVYAYLLQAGRFLLAVSPSRTAWEERPDHWTDPLRVTWLWN